MKDYKLLKRKDKLKYLEKTQKVEIAYEIYNDNKTKENVDLWFKVLRGD